MGINDRDYARQDSSSGTFRGGGGGRGLQIGKWSVNTWLIAICVAVFMVDQFLPRMLAPIRAVPVMNVEGRLIRLPESAEVDPTDRSTIRLPGLRQIHEGREIDGRRVRAPIFVEINGSFVPREVSNLRSLPSSFMLQAYRIEDGKTVPAVGTATIRDENGNSVRGDVLLLEHVQVAGPLWVWGYFSTSTALLTLDQYVGFRGFEFWRFITFQFLHADLMHLLFNMIGLYFFGSLVEQYLGSKRYLAFYLICGMAGAGMYLMLNFAGWSVFSLTGRDLPVLLVNDPGTPLVGASAGVFGVVMASAFLVPNARVLLFFVIPMRLSTLAYGLVAVALLSVFFGSQNAGGQAAHIGGALAGFWFIRHPHSLHGFFDFLGRYDPTSRSGAAYRAGRLRTAGAVEDAEVDRILGKIHREGLQGLTSREKKILREASKR
jgi:membrane associated rhomboid family serine protease